MEDATGGHRPGLAHTFHEKLIRLGSMDPPLRLAAVGATAMVVLAALLLLPRDLPLPTVRAGRSMVPLPVAVACSLFLALAWAYLLAGALHAHGALRLTLLVCYSAAMLLLGADGIGQLLLVLIALSQVWTLAGALWWLDRDHDRRNPELHHRHRLKLPTLLLCCVSSALCVGALWLGAGQAAAWSLERSGLAIEVAYLSLLVVPMLFLSGSDFAEWGEVLAGRLSVLVEGAGRRWPAGVLTAATALVILAVQVRSGSGDLANLTRRAGLATLTVAAIVAIWALVRRRAGPAVPSWTLAVAGLGIPVLILIESFAVAISGEQGDQANRLALLIGAVVAAVGSGVLLLRRTSRGTSGGLYLLAVGLSFGLAQSNSTVDGYLLVTAGAGVALCGLALLPRMRPLLDLLPGLLTLLVGLQILSWITLAMKGGADLGRSFTGLQALLLLGAIFWDIAMSGEAITNRHGRHLPRHTRVLLYFGYQLLVVTAVLYTSSVLAPQGGETGGLEPHAFVRAGLIELGAPMLLVLFLLGLRRPALSGERQAVVR
jgi:hypothetical protein